MADVERRHRSNADEAARLDAVPAVWAPRTGRDRLRAAADDRADPQVAEPASTPTSLFVDRGLGRDAGELPGEDLGRCV
jgi:hypothetical protein